MKGLVIKDFLIIRSAIKTSVIFVFFYMILGFFTKDFSSVSTILIILLAMLAMTTLAYDERAKFNTYALTMPLSSLDIVLGKYIFGLILLIIGGLFSIIPYFFWQTSATWGEKMFIIGISVASGIFLQSFVLPMMFKLGAEKGRIYMLMSFFIPTVLLVSISKTSFGISMIKFTASLSPFTIMSAILFVITLTFILSVIVSIKIVNKNRFVL